MGSLSAEETTWKADVLKKTAKYDEKEKAAKDNEKEKGREW